MRRQAGISRYAPALGATHIGRLRAWVLVAGFLLTIFLVPAIDLTGEARERLGRAASDAVRAASSEWNSREDLVDGVFAANREILNGIDAMESEAEEASFMARHLRPYVQWVLLGLGAGNERVYPGREGWLFYRPEIDYLTARKFASRPLTPGQTIAEFAADLAERDIQLFLVPVPGKPLLHPEKFAGGSSFELPPQNPAWPQFLAALEQAARTEFTARGLDFPLPEVIDPTEQLWKGEGDQFLKTDSHWTPGAMSTTADLVVQRLRDAEIEPAGGSFEVESETVSGKGDTAVMLELPESSRWNALQEVEIERVATEDDPGSDILLLGDSFSNIYSQPGLGWGESAGFPEHLARGLGKSIDAILRNDGGASATRKILATELARNPSRLEGKRAVVWQFAMRELAVGTWESTPLVESIRPTREMLVLKPGQTKSLHGEILQTGPQPRAGETPYADFLTAFLVQDDSGQHAVVYLETMRKHSLTPSARLRPGDRVTLEITSWSDAEPIHGSTNRGELDDIELQLQEPNFGSLLP